MQGLVRIDDFRGMMGGSECEAAESTATGQMRGAAVEFLSALGPACFRAAFGGGSDDVRARRQRRAAVRSLGALLTARSDPGGLAAVVLSPE